MDVWSPIAGQGKEQHNYVDNRSVRNIPRYAGKEDPVVWTCNEKRRGGRGGGFGRCRG